MDSAIDAGPPHPSTTLDCIPTRNPSELLCPLPDYRYSQVTAFGYVGDTGVPRNGCLCTPYCSIHPAAAPCPLYPGTTRETVCAFDREDWDSVGACHLRCDEDSDCPEGSFCFELELSGFATRPDFRKACVLERPIR